MWVTDTVGVSINVPRTLFFTALTKYEGVRTRHLSGREFHQSLAAAGRASFARRLDVVNPSPTQLSSGV